MSADVWLCLIAHNRMALTRKCVEALCVERDPRLRVVAIDTGSSDDTPAYLQQARRDGDVQELILNEPGALPQWQKNAAIGQFVQFLRTVEHSHAGWVDGDVTLGPGWLAAAVDCLTGGPPELEVVSLHNDAEQERVHPTLREVVVGGRRLRLKASANGAAWVFGHGFFDRHGLPPVGRGINEQTVEDWYYSRILQAKGLLFGVLDGLAEHIGADRSLRVEAQERLYGAPAELPPRIAVDARTVEPHMHGIGIYAHRLIRCMAEQAPRTAFVVLCGPGGRGLFGGFPPNVEPLDCPVALGDSCWEAELGAPWCQERGIGLYHGTSYGCTASDRIPSIATVHDVSFATTPQFYSPEFVRHMTAELHHTLEHADHVITVSSHVRDALIGRFSAPAGQVTAVHSGPGQFDVPAPTHGERSYLLAMDMGQPRKNTANVIRAFALLCREHGFAGQLKIVERGWHVAPDLRALCEELGIADRVDVTGEVDVDGLASLYARAACLVYPSFDEGFGFPPLEAMQFGTPVVVSPCGSLPEICGDAALQVDPEQPAAIAAAVHSIVSDPQVAGDLSRRSLARAADFSWERCARETLSVYARATVAGGPVRSVPNPQQAVAHEPCVAMVTTWNVPCGVAESTRRLVECLAEDYPVTVLSETHEGDADPSERQSWRRPDDLASIRAQALAAGCSIAHIQYHPAFFFDEDAFCTLLWDLKLAGIGTVVTLHELSGRPPVWTLVPDLLIAHSASMRDHVRQGGITTPCTVIPLPMPDLVEREGPSPGDSKVVLKTVGFLHPNRGHRLGLEVLAKLTETCDAEYHVAGQVAQGQEGYPDELRAHAARLGIADRFQLRIGYLSDEAFAAEWRSATVGLLPYSYVGIGSSGAVLDALSADIPVITSTSPFFDGLGDAVCQADSPDEMAALVDGIAGNGDMSARMAAARRSLAEVRRPALRAERHERAYEQVLARLHRTTRRKLRPWISLHIIARETSRLGLEVFRSCIDSLRGYPDEFVIVDNGCSEDVRTMFGAELSDARVKVIDAPSVSDFALLRNLALERTAPEATHVHWVDTDEVFLPADLPRLRDALSDPDISVMHVLLVHFMREPTVIQDVQVNRCIFRRTPQLHWESAVHEKARGLAPGRESFFPIRFLHFGYARPQWETCLKWLSYAQLERGNLDRYRWEVVDGERRPWFGDRRTPDTILDERATRPYDGEYPSSCARWLEAWAKSGQPWRDYLADLVDQSPWHEWQRMAVERGSWEATLDDMLRAWERPGAEP